MREVSIDGNILNIGGTKITVKYPIKQVESISGKYVVLLKIPRVELGAEELNNILCYNEEKYLGDSYISLSPLGLGGLPGPGLIGGLIGG